MVTPADFATFQQQLRREMADVIQQLRAEVNESINGRMDMLNCINAALQNASTRPAESKPYRISDLILPRNWERSNEKGEFRRFMSDLHLWVQAWSNQGERECLSVLRVAISLTTTRLHLIARMKSSDRLKHRCIKS